MSTTSNDFLLSEFDILIAWMRERDRIRALKESGAPKPWTTDCLLRDFRWCNVRRMDDRVSRWLLEHWYPAFRHDSQTELVAAVLARLINWPDALAEVVALFPDLDRTRGALHARKSAERKIFTGAYVVPGVPGQDKIDSVLALVGKVQSEASEIITTGSMRATWQRLIVFPGLGSFLAGQVVADLAFVGLGESWPDRNVWAPVGPGSARGLNRLRGRPKDAAVSQADFEHWLPRVCSELRPHVESLWQDCALIPMDIQNCLCEFDKYRRLTLNEGTVRARYDGQSRQVALL